MPIDYSVFAAGGFPKGTPAKLAKHQKDTEHDRKLAAAYRKVEVREDNVCQASGVKLEATSANDKRRREHHHLKGRNVKPEWVYQASRIVLVSAFVHQLITDGEILVIGTDAPKVRFKWNRNIVKGQPRARLEKVS